MRTFAVRTKAAFAAAQRSARPGDTIDVNAKLAGEVKITKPGLTFDFRDGGIDANGAPHALLVLADNTTVRGGIFEDARGAGVAVRDVLRFTATDSEVRDNGGSGISIIQSDRVGMARVHVHHNATEKGGASGISIFHPVRHEAGGPGVRFVVRDSAIHDNGSKTHRQTDAFGIIADDFQWRQSDEHPAFRGTTWLYHNDLHDNGGPGIGAINSDGVHAERNTLHDNQAQDEFGRLANVDFEFRHSTGQIDHNDIAGRIAFNGTLGRPVDVSGDDNTAAGHYLRGAAIELPEYEPHGVQADPLHWG